MDVADTAQETLQGIQARPVDSYELVRGHVPEPEPEPLLGPGPGPELAPASLQRPDCYTWAAAGHVDKLTTGLLKFETTTLLEGLDCGVAVVVVAVAVHGHEDEEN